MRYVLLTLIPSLILSSCATGSGNQMAETIVNGVQNEIILIEVPDELDVISDDEQYGNFEIAVPEITKEVYDNANITAYIQRTYEDDRPDRWSQLPQVFLNSDNSTSAYLSFGEGFIRISFQSEESVDELFELFSDRVLKLVIVN
ncbi:MAG: hypothetical protein ISQ42_01560 [Flavobacteriaceae bacterium]|nr:hypothetical protein [Flavobacteriaceae bacterium]